MSADRPPLIVDLKRNALDDGPGIRSVLFFKGCPLRCVWCQNPESLRLEAEIQRDASACAGCGRCRAACPPKRARPAAEREDGADCRLCGRCVEACPANARRVAGTGRGVDDLVAALLRDEVFYRRSGGGVTFSGGEPTLFPELAGAIAQRLRARGVHVLLETCGHFPWEGVREHLLPHLSAVYFDLKLADPEQHRRHTGVDNARIHENLRRLATSGTDLLPRVPLVPGITDAPENLRALADLLRGLGLRRAALLPYNPLWLGKRRALGLELPYAHDAWMSPADVARCARVFAEAGIAVAS